MESIVDSTDRSTADYLFFALAFLGFMIFVGGIIVSSPATTFAGVLLWLLSVVSFRLRRGRAA